MAVLLDTSPGTTTWSPPLKVSGLGDLHDAVGQPFIPDAKWDVTSFEMYLQSGNPSLGSILTVGLYLQYQVASSYPSFF